jgi:hypothetical protein
MEYFKSFAEDWNTMTLADKYYSLDAWEAQEAARKARERAASGHAEPVINLIAEEAAHKKALQEAAKKRERERLEMYRSSLAGSERAAGLRQQEELRMQMQLAFKSGNKREVERIQKLLAPQAAPEFEGEG